MNPNSFVDTVAIEPDSEFEQFLSSYRSVFTLDGRSLEGLQADLSSQQRHQEPHLRSRLFTITEGLESLRSPFVVMAEPCLRDISLGGGKDWGCQARRHDYLALASVYSGTTPQIRLHLS